MDYSKRDYGILHERSSKQTRQDLMLAVGAGLVGAAMLTAGIYLASVALIAIGAFLLFAAIVSLSKTIADKYFLEQPEKVLYSSIDRASTSSTNSALDR